VNENNEYRLGQPIPFTEEGEIRISRGSDLIEVLEVQLTWSWIKKITVFILFLFGLAFVSILVLNLSNLRPLEIPIQPEQLATMVHFRWSHPQSLFLSTFDIERQVKRVGNSWGPYSRIGQAMTEQDSCVFVDSAVEPNTNYRYRIFKSIQTRFRVIIFIRRKKIIEVLTLPSKPEIVSAISLSDHQVVLRWQQPSGAGKFEVSRGENQADLKLLEVSQDQIRQENGQHVYTDQGLTPNTRYWYTLVAWNRSGPSERVDPVCTLTRPSPPANLKIEDASGGVRLSWLYSDNVSGFRLEASRTDNDYRIVRNNISPDAQSFVDTISEDKQWYRIIAYNESGDSQPTTLPPQPIVKSVQPKHGAPGGNTQITISGTGFGEESKQVRVRIGENDAQVVSVTPLSIAAATPRGRGIQDVIVEINHKSFTLPRSFAYAYGLVEIPPADVLPENAKIEVSVDGEGYSLSKKQQEVPWTRTPPSILLRNGMGYEFKPPKEIFAGGIMNLYLCYIELRKPFPKNSTVHIREHNTKVAITEPYLTSQSPIILLLSNSSKWIDVIVKKDREGEELDGIYGYELSLNRPLRREDWK